MSGAESYGTFTQQNTTQEKEISNYPTLCDSMDGTGEHIPKCNYPGDERQIPYDLTQKGT